MNLKDRTKQFDDEFWERVIDQLDSEEVQEELCKRGIYHHGPKTTISPSLYDKTVPKIVRYKYECNYCNKKLMIESEET